MTLAEILQPIEFDRFRRDYLGQQYLLVKGPTERFQELLSWPRLSEALQTLRVDAGRVGLVKQGKGINRDEYIYTSPRGAVQYLDGAGLAKHIAEGATLVVNHVDELFGGVRQLAESCEALCRSYVIANLYAGWRTDNGFQTHWDGHDTLVVQIRGRKNWQVWRPTRLHPVSDEARSLAPLPSEPPVWAGCLEEGDVLYMPRGWWHVAHPRNEPSLHITFGFKHATGYDLMAWVLEQAKVEAVDMRADVPHWRDEEGQREWIARLGAVCQRALTEDVVERFMAATDHAHSRPIVSLPESSQAMNPTLSDCALLRLVKRSRLYLTEIRDTDDLSFNIGGARWTCPKSLGPALRMLNHIVPQRLMDLHGAIDASAGSALRSFLNLLIMKGEVWIEPAARTDDVVPAGEEDASLSAART